MPFLPPQNKTEKRSGGGDNIRSKPPLATNNLLENTGQCSLGATSCYLLASFSRWHSNVHHHHDAPNNAPGNSSRYASLYRASFLYRVVIKPGGIGSLIAIDPLQHKPHVIGMCKRQHDIEKVDARRVGLSTLTTYCISFGCYEFQLARGVIITRTRLDCKLLALIDGGSSYCTCLARGLEVLRHH